MKGYLGIDTSNYTTSTAVYCPEHDLVLQKKKLLPVPAGALGLRQSDAGFITRFNFLNFWRSFQRNLAEKFAQLPYPTRHGMRRAPICPVFWPGCLLRVRLRLF